MELNGYYHALVTAQVSQFSESQQELSTTNTREEEIDEDLDPITMTSEVRMCRSYW